MKDLIEQGIFYLPHIMFDSEWGLSKHERLIFIALFSLEDKFIHKMKGSIKKEW